MLQVDTSTSTKQAGLEFHVSAVLTVMSVDLTCLFAKIWKELIQIQNKISINFLGEKSKQGGLNTFIAIILSLFKVGRV